MKKETLALTHELMSCIMQTDHWENILATDPSIQDAERRLKAALAPLTSPEHKDHRERLSSAAWGLAVAYGDVGTCYGYHVAQVLQAIGESPQEYSRYILDRIRGGGGAQ